MRTRSSIDFDWRFALGDFPGAIGPDFDDSAWCMRDLPHDWSIEATPDPANPAGAGGGFFPGGLGWYRKMIDIPEDLGGRRVLIEFDGVYMNSEVWCNGRFCGMRPYGYSSFCYDLTPFVKAGKKASIAVRVDNSRQKNSRWYSGSGIYRHVWLTIAGPVRVDHWGTYVTTPEVSAEKAVVSCDVTVVNQGVRDANVEISVSMLGAGGSGGPAVEIPVPAGKTESTNLKLDIASPRLWSPDSPNLYTLRVELKHSGVVIDRYYTRFGIRSIRFDAEKGFFLNGESIKLQGVNEHHDAGCLGAAVPDDVVRRRFRILKEMGCNAVRVAHNPASPAFLDLCDEMGLMVVEDAFDEWVDGKTPFGYQLYWDQWWERDLVDMIRRDRNHPCVVMWSVGNEIKEVREGRPEGLPIMKALRDVCHREDPTRPMTCGCCSSRATLAAGYGEFMDVFGYNGGGGGCFDYEKDHAAFPGMCMFATEVPHSLQTRGVYRTKTWYRDMARNGDNIMWHTRFDGDVPPPAVTRSVKPGKEPLELMYVPDLTDDEVFTGFDAHYQSSYDNAMVRISSTDSWRRTKMLPYMCGEFRWTGFDYLGECYAWPAKSWNFGIIDLCGFPKDTYYFYQSEWTKDPMVHILPHWTWPGLEGRVIPVICYSNCERVELFLNGESLGVRERDPRLMHMRWDVEYKPGELKAVGYSGDNTVRCVHETAGRPAAVRIICEEQVVRSDRTGIAHLPIRIVDECGVLVPHAACDVKVRVEGSARLIGLENGDPIDSTNYKLNHRKVFHGMMLAVVQVSEGGGNVVVHAEAEGLSGGSCEIMLS